MPIVTDRPIMQLTARITNDLSTTLHTQIYFIYAEIKLNLPGLLWLIRVDRLSCCRRRRCVSDVAVTMTALLAAMMSRCRCCTQPSSTLRVLDRSRVVLSSALSEVDRPIRVSVVDCLSSRWLCCLRCLVHETSAVHHHVLDLRALPQLPPVRTVFETLTRTGARRHPLGPGSDRWYLSSPVGT